MDKVLYYDIWYSNNRIWIAKVVGHPNNPSYITWEELMTIGI